MAHQVTVTLPDRVYEELHRRAKEQKKSVKKVVEEMLCVAVAPEETLSLALEAELTALAEKSDEELWQIAESQLPLSDRRRFARLINKHEAGKLLTPDEQQELKALMEEGDRLTVLKSAAYALLKQRGHRLPTPEEFRRRRRA